jgi:4-amino-4-deoxy-L-arabinose transferase-like glycosyltransferase
MPWLLLVVCTATLFWGLGRTALWEPDEPRFAEATRQMLLRGDYLTPWFNGQPRFEKPVLMYWMQLPFYLLLGPTELAARLPSALCGLLTVFLVYRIGRQLVSPRAGLFAGLVLATTLRFVLYARQGLTDVPVTAFVALGIFGFVTAAQASGRRAAVFVALAWTAVGCAALTKGPVAIFAPAVWLAFAWLTAGMAGVRRMHLVAGAALALAVTLPWFAVMYVRHGEPFVRVSLGYEVVARYMSPEFPGRQRGFLFYWGVWFGDGAPWSFFYAAGVVWSIVRWRSIRPEVRRAALLSGLWFTLVLLVFSFSQYKLPHYILPAYPAMALGVGSFADEAWKDAVVPRRLWRIPGWLSSAALGAAAVLLYLLLRRAFALPMTDRAFALPLLLAAGAAAALACQVRARDEHAFVCVIAALVAAYGYLSGVVAPRELRRFQPIPELAAALRTAAAPQDPVAVEGNYGAPGLVFYTHHPVEQLQSREALVSFLSGPGRRFCVLPRYDLEAVQPEVHRPLRVMAEAGVFSVRMRRLLERDPERAARTLVAVAAE